jgi:hypothetical protein
VPDSPNPYPCRCWVDRFLQRLQLTFKKNPPARRRTTTWLLGLLLVALFWAVVEAVAWGIGNAAVAEAAWLVMVHRSLSVTILTVIGLRLARRLRAHVRPLLTKTPAVTWLAARASVNSALRSASRAAPDGPHGEHALWQPHCCVRRYRSAFVSSRDRAACPSAPVAVWLVTDQLARARNPVPMYRGAGVRPTLNSPKRRHVLFLAPAGQLAIHRGWGRACGALVRMSNSLFEGLREGDSALFRDATNHQIPTSCA